MEESRMNNNLINHPTMTPKGNKGVRKLAFTRAVTAAIACGVYLIKPAGLLVVGSGGLSAPGLVIQLSQL